MPIRQTHTFAVLHVSPATYNEVYQLLKAAGYDHVFIEQENRTVIDMHGIALAAKPVEDVGMDDSEG